MSETTLFRFDSESDVLAWHPINDVVMGGVSTSSATWSANQSLVFSGTVSLENNGGFASITSPTHRLDLHAYHGIRLMIQGDGKEYKFTLRTETAMDGISYQTTFLTKAGEQMILDMPFTDFVPTYHGRVVESAPPPDPSRITRCGFIISNRQDGPFRLQVFAISAY